MSKGNSAWSSAMYSARFAAVNVDWCWPYVVGGVAPTQMSPASEFHRPTRPDATVLPASMMSSNDASSASAVRTAPYLFSGCKY